MNRTMISEAVGYIDEKYVLEAMELFYRDTCPIDRDEEGIIPIRGKRHLGRAGKIALVAAVAAAILAMTAFAVSVLGGRVETIIFDIGGKEERGIAILTSDDGPIVTGFWYPQGIPEEYVLQTKIYETNSHTLAFENEAGEEIIFECQKAMYVEGSGEIGLPSIIPMWVEEWETVQIGEVEGIYITNALEEQSLWWGSNERSVGFHLHATDMSVDLVKIALSVEEQERPEFPIDNNTEKAIENLGDYKPVVLPEGYEYYCVNGMPNEDDNGDSWHGYVIYSYMNEQGEELRLEYEVISGNDDTSQDSYIDRYIPDYDYTRENAPAYTCSYLTIGGFQAGLAEDENGMPVKLAWLDLEAGLVFSLKADNLTSEELIAVAESVALVE